MAVVAKAANLEPWAVQKLLVDAFGFPECAEAVALDVPQLRWLAGHVEKRGYAVMAHSLRVLASKTEETPSHLLPLEATAPNPVVVKFLDDLVVDLHKAHGVPVHAWQKRADLQ